jgi:hypothetical protein
MPLLGRSRNSQTQEPEDLCLRGMTPGSDLVSPAPIRPSSMQDSYMSMPEAGDGLDLDCLPKRKSMKLPF